MNDHDDKTPLDQVLDVFVYLPVGLALDLRRLAPQLIERGREEVASGKALTRYALRPRSSSGLARLQDQAVGTLQALGVLPAPERPGPITPSATIERRPAGRPAATAGAPDDGTAARPAAPAAPAGSGIDPETLAIPDYDSLSASQVVPRLESLQVDELELVRRYEAGARGRKTILNKIAQLQAG